MQFEVVPGKNARNLPNAAWTFRRRRPYGAIAGLRRWPTRREHLWRSLKQEEVYRRAYETVAEARKGIADYLRYFNEERPHQGLDNRTPDDVFYERKPLAKAAEPTGKLLSRQCWKLWRR